MELYKSSILVPDVVDQDRLICEQSNQPDDLAESFLKIVRGHQPVAEIFQTAVASSDLASSDFFGCAGREQELVLLTADIDNGTSVVIHALPPLCSTV